MQKAIISTAGESNARQNRPLPFTATIEHVSPTVPSAELRQTRQKVMNRLYEIFAKYEETPIEK